MKPPMTLTVGCGLIGVTTFIYLCWHFIATYGQFAELYNPLMRAGFYIVVLIFAGYILLKVYQGIGTYALHASIVAVSISLAALISELPFMIGISGFAVLGVLLLWSPSARDYYVDVRRNSSVE